ncbi:MAG: MIP/aquaporin family protein [Alphaproteobacteria bacterium]
MIRPFSLAQRLAAEALGTGLLVATVVGSGYMAETLADGNDAIALLGNTIATGAILFVLITIFVRISGAHFNPAVTVGFAIRRDLRWPHAASYIVAQVAGGVLGAVLAHAMFALPLVQSASNMRTGGAQWLAEGVATFGLLLTIYGCVRFRPQAVAAAVGLYITAGYWFTASTSFANPAVTIGRTLTDTFSGIRPIDAPGFIAAQLVGAVLATWLAIWLFRSPHDGRR